MKDEEEEGTERSLNPHRLAQWDLYEDAYDEESMVNAA